MAYTPTNWKNGDVVTSAKLNKLENGVAGAGGVLVCHEDETTGALDHTFKEIADAGFAVLYADDTIGTDVGMLNYLDKPSAGTYGVSFSVNGQDKLYAASAENEYPVAYDNAGSGGDDSPKF